MKKYILIILILGFGTSRSLAQERFGLEIKLVPYSALKLSYLDQKEMKVRDYPQLGYYYQGWMTDRKYLYRKVGFQYSKVKDKSPVSAERVDGTLWVLYSSFGRGYYLNHREFEDDLSPYVSWGIGCGLTGAKELWYAPGSTVGEPRSGDITGTVGFEFGFGIEKSLSRKWLLNASLEAHYQYNLYNPLYIGLTSRFLYRRY